MTRRSAFDSWLLAPFDGHFPDAVATRWRGETVRSWPLPETTAHRLVTTIDGRCFVAQEHHLVAIDGDEVSWSVETAERLDDLALVDRRVLAVAEGGLLTFRDPRTGSIVASRQLDDGSIRGMSQAASGVLVQIGSPSRSPEVWIVDPTGAIGARCSLDVGSWRPPRVLGDTVVVVDGGRVRGFSPTLEPLWVADRHGFHDADVPAPSGDERVETAVRVVDSTSLIVGISWPAGYGFFRFDLRRRRVVPVPTVDPRLHVIYPMVLALDEPETRLVTVGVDRMPACIDLSGRLLWRQTELSPPIQIATDAARAVLTVHSPRADIWRAYRDYVEEPSCFLRLRRLDDGAALGIWEAPGPIAPCVALVPGGVMVVAEGTLFRLR